MLLVRQLRNLHLNGAKKLIGNAQLQPIAYSIQLKTHSQLLNRLNTTPQFEINNGLNIACSNSNKLVGIRHYYRNYQDHPSRIVRAYRKTRTWLTDHFVIADRRFENIYSFTFFVTICILGIVSAYLNLQLGGDAVGYDVDKIQKYKPDDK